MEIDSIHRLLFLSLCGFVCCWGCAQPGTFRRTVSFGIGNEKQQIGAVISEGHVTLTASVWCRFKDKWVIADRVNKRLKIFRSDGTFRRSTGAAFFRKGRDVAGLFPYGDRLLVVVRSYDKSSAEASDTLHLIAADGTRLQSVSLPRDNGVVEDILDHGDAVRLIVAYPRVRIEKKGTDTKDAKQSRPRYQPPSLVVYRYERMHLREVTTLQGTVAIPASRFLSARRIDRQSVYDLRLYRFDELIGLFEADNHVFLFRCDDTLTDFEIISRQFHDRHALLAAAVSGRWFLQETREDGQLDITAYAALTKREQSYRIPERSRHGRCRRVIVTEGHVSALFATPQRVTLYHY